MVTLTDIAAEKVRGFLAPQETEGEVGLRVGVRGGGCSGFQYALALDEKRDDDLVFDYDGIRLIVDPASMRYVDGSQVDYTESLMGAGFEVNNPNVVASCGCGSSFRIADEEPSCTSSASRARCRASARGRGSPASGAAATAARARAAARRRVARPGRRPAEPRA